MRILAILLALASTLAAQSTPPCTTVSETLYVPGTSGNVLMPTGSSVQLALGYTVPTGGTLLGPGSVRTVITNGTWSPRQAYQIGLQVVDTNGNTQQVTQAGTSGANTPGWATGIGAITNDGPVKWTNLGALSLQKSISICLSAGNWTALWTVLQSAAGQPLSPITYTRYWTVPSSGPVTVTSIQATTPPTPSLSIAPTQIVPGVNGQCLTTTSGVSIWASCAGITSLTTQVIGNSAGTVQGLSSLTYNSSGALGVNTATPFTRMAIVVEGVLTPPGQATWNIGDTVPFSGGGSGTVLAGRSTRQLNIATLYLYPFSGNISGTFTGTTCTVCPVITVTSTHVYSLTSGVDANGNLNSSSKIALSVLGVPFAYQYDPPATDGRNLFFGLGAGNTTMTSDNNTAGGTVALHNITSGCCNALWGINAGYACTTCFYVSGTGGDVFENVTTGHDMTGEGHLAGSNLTTQADAICVGSGACLGLTTGGTNSIFIGDSQPNTVQGYGIFTGTGNVVIGHFIAGLADVTDNIVLGDGDGHVDLQVDNLGVPTFARGLPTTGFVQSTGGRLTSATLTSAQVLGACVTCVTSAASLADTQLMMGSGGAQGAASIPFLTSNGTSLTMGANGTKPFTLSSSSSDAMFIQAGATNAGMTGNFYPNGTSPLSRLRLWNGSDTTNTNNANINLIVQGATASLQVSTIGTGTAITNYNVGETSTSSVLTNYNIQFGGVTKFSMTPTTATFAAYAQGVAHFSSAGLISSSAVNLASSDVTTPGSDGQMFYRSAGVVTADPFVTSDGGTLTMGANGTKPFTFSSSSNDSMIIQAGATNAGMAGDFYPNGTSLLSRLRLWNSSDTTNTNASNINLIVQGATASLQVSTIGTGTAITTYNVGETSTSSVLANYNVQFGGTTKFNLTPTTATLAAYGAGIAHFSSAGLISSSPVSLTDDVSGNLPVANLNGGTGASSSTFWRGDATWVRAAIVVASGTSALGTGAIASGACATVVTGTATGTLTTDNIIADFNADPTSTTGYSPSTGGMLTIIKYPTVDTFNAKVCNNTGSSITPGAITLNWRIER